MYSSVELRLPASPLAAARCRAANTEHPIACSTRACPRKRRRRIELRRQSNPPGLTSKFSFLLQKASMGQPSSVVGAGSVTWYLSSACRGKRIGEIPTLRNTPLPPHPLEAGLHVEGGGRQVNFICAHGAGDLCIAKVARGSGSGALVASISGLSGGQR